MGPRSLVLMLCLVLTGGHVAMLQVVAWTAMLVTRTQANGWDAAVASTFSGRQPCRMCMAVQDLAKAGQDPGAPVPGKGDPKGILKPVKKADAAGSTLEPPTLVACVVRITECQAPGACCGRDLPAPEPPPPQT